MKRRFPRRDVSGAPGWQVNSAGVLFHNRREAIITDSIAGWPTVDMGRDYAGPILPAGNQGCSERLRLVDEIVAYEFCERPDVGLRGCHVLHLDGDMSNCHPENLRWAPSPAYAMRMNEHRITLLLCPDWIPKRRSREWAATSTFKRRGPTFVSSNSVEGWKPVGQKGNANAA